MHYPTHRFIARYWQPENNAKNVLFMHITLAHAELKVSVKLVFFFCLARRANFIWWYGSTPLKFFWTSWLHHYRRFTFSHVEPTLPFRFSNAISLSFQSGPTWHLNAPECVWNRSALSTTSSHIYKLASNCFTKIAGYCPNPRQLRTITNFFIVKLLTRQANLKECLYIWLKIFGDVCFVIRQNYSFFWLNRFWPPFCNVMI